MRMVFIIAAVVALGVAVVFPRQSKGTGSTDIEHGKYLAEKVAMCIQCHTPRDEEGNLLLDQRFRGAPIPFTSPFPNSQWANTAPRIAGLPQYSTDQAVKLFTTGISRTGAPLRSPMPPFRMSESDARDIIAYLQSIQ